jgi:hypothetical protein
LASKQHARSLSRVRRSSRPRAAQNKLELPSAASHASNSTRGTVLVLAAVHLPGLIARMTTIIATTTSVDALALTRCMTSAPPPAHVDHKGGAHACDGDQRSAERRAARARC